MNGRELRNEIRLSSKVLPPHLRKITVLSHGAEIEARVVDASCGGFGFHIDMPSHAFTMGSILVIFPLGPDFPVYGQKVSVRPLTDSMTRIGVILKEQGAYRKYRKVMESLVLNQNPSI